MVNWEAMAVETITRLAGGQRVLQTFAEANLEAAKNTFEGKGPDAAEADARTGLRAVVNIASVHVPTFCKRSQNHISPAYQNKYDLDQANVRVGDDPPDDHWSKREIVDQALASLHGRAMNEVYYAAAELNGAGIRFYGDICLVLKPEQVESDTVVLDRNSYDVLRAPLDAVAAGANDETEKQMLRRMVLSDHSGKFRPDLKTIGALKVLVATGERDRRFSSGQISNGILDDEDYIEILKIGSFHTGDVEAARLSAAEVALEGHVEQRLRSDPWSHAAQRWLTQRRNATQGLRNCGIEVSIMTTSGRLKN
jgi:hypothetical protein